MTNQEKDNRAFGRALRELRHEAGVTQDAVARCAGYEQPHVSRIEYGLTPASVPMLAGYARATKNPQAVMRLVAAAIQRNGRVS
ncbi:MAG: helix-turn-helix domain-containing protein [Bacilli bacterium]